MKKILVTGANGMLGREVCKCLTNLKYEVVPISRKNLDLRDYKSTYETISKSRPFAIVHCAAVVGGIQANIEGGAKFLTDNLAIDTSVLKSAKELSIKNLVYIGSSCMYPANFNHALKENELLAGKLEVTNQNYALAKIIGSRIVECIAQENNFNWRIFIASNLYGPGDNFDFNKGHLVAAIIMKSIKAKAENTFLEMWGDGTPRREFTYVEDFANWICTNLEKLEVLPLYLNLGSGFDLSVREYYEIILKLISYNGNIVANPNKPNGNIRKLMDSSEAKKYGWNPKTSLEDGLMKTIKWYEANVKGK